MLTCIVVRKYGSIALNTLSIAVHFAFGDHRVGFWCFVVHVSFPSLNLLAQLQQLMDITI